VTLTSGSDPEPRGSVQFVSFDSTWADNAKAPGAICSVHFDGLGFTDFRPPELVGFDSALG
jgi:predicted RNase H-like nuclease